MRGTWYTAAIRLKQTKGLPLRDRKVRHGKPKMRDSVYLFAGGVGLGLLEAAIEWLSGLVPPSSMEDELVRIWSPWRGTVRTVESPVLFMGLDTDPASREKYGPKLESELAMLGVSYRYIDVGGSSVFLDPRARAVYSRLEADSDKVRGEVLKALTDTGFNTRSPNAVFYVNSMHGYGSAINTFLAEKVVADLLPATRLKAMVAIADYPTGLICTPDYYDSLRWSLGQIGRLLESRRLDFVLVVESTLVAALSSVVRGLVGADAVRRAYEPLLKELHSSGYAFEAYVKAYRQVLLNMARLAKVDPRDANEFIAGAVSPLSFLVSIGPAAGREVTVSSSSIDFVDVKRMLYSSNPSMRPYVSVAYLPGSYIRMYLRPPSLEKIIKALGLSWLSPLDVGRLVHFVLIFGDRLRQELGISGTDFRLGAERVVKNAVRFNGSIDVLVVDNCDAVWAVAVHEGEAVLRGLYGVDGGQEGAGGA